MANAILLLKWLDEHLYYSLIIPYYHYFKGIISLCTFLLVYKIPHNFQKRQNLYQKLEKSELEIKNIEPKLGEQFFLIDNDSFEGSAIDKKKEILTEYARVLDNYYLEIANACELTMKLKLKKPSIFLNNLVKTLLDETYLTLYDRLNKKRNDSGFEKLDCHAIKDSEKIMKSFDIKYNKSFCFKICRFYRFSKLSLHRYKRLFCFKVCRFYRFSKHYLFSSMHYLYRQLKRWWKLIVMKLI